MPLTTEEKKARHLAMFGVEDMEKHANELLDEMPIPNPVMLATSMLSDAQELVSRMTDSDKETVVRRAEQVRQLVNQAK